MKNAWDKIMDDDFEAGYRIADESYSQSLQHYDLRARAVSSFLLQDYEAALADFLILKQDELLSNMVSDNTYLSIGLCYFAVSNIEKAVEYFVYPVKNGKLIKYTSDITVASSILFYIGLRMQRSDIQKIAINSLKKLKQIIPQFILDIISDDDVVKFYDRESHPVMQNRNQCKLEFYKSLNALRVNDLERWIECLKNCVALKGSYLEFEYFMAITELNKLEIS